MNRTLFRMFAVIACLAATAGTSCRKDQPPSSGPAPTPRAPPRSSPRPPGRPLPAGAGGEGRTGLVGIVGRGRRAALRPRRRGVPSRAGRGRRVQDHRVRFHPRGELAAAALSRPFRFARAPQGAARRHDLAVRHGAGGQAPGPRPRSRDAVLRRAPAGGEDRGAAQDRAAAADPPGDHARDEQAFFATHQDSTTARAGQRRPILVATEAEAQAIIALVTAPGAERNLFAQLAGEKSLDATPRIAAATSPSSRGRGAQRPVPLRGPRPLRVVFECRTSATSSPSRAHGRRLARAQADRQARRRVRTLEQVRPTVRVGIEEERFQEAWKKKLEEIEAQLGVELHPENLADVRPTLPSPDELERLHGHGRTDVPTGAAPPSPRSSRRARRPAVVRLRLPPRPRRRRRPRPREVIRDSTARRTAPRRRARPVRRARRPARAAEGSRGLRRSSATTSSSSPRSRSAPPPSWPRRCAARAPSFATSRCGRSSIPTSSR